eukprot:1150807-Pelagomonas_calceolata.AAC.1
MASYHDHNFLHTHNVKEAYTSCGLSPHLQLATVAGRSKDAGIAYTSIASKNNILYVHFHLTSNWLRWWMAGRSKDTGITRTTCTSSVTPYEQSITGSSKVTFQNICKAKCKLDKTVMGVMCCHEAPLIGKKQHTCW